MNLANIKRLHCQIIFIELHLFVDQVTVNFLAYFVRETTPNPNGLSPKIHKFRGVINIKYSVHRYSETCTISFQSPNIISGMAVQEIRFDI